MSLGSIALALLTGVASRGVHVSLNVSRGVLGLIMLCLALSVSCLVLPTDDPQSGHTALSAATFASNAAPDLRAFSGLHGSFTLMFGLVFPAFTGVLAGSNLPGKLRTPSRSIARGTLSSLAFVLVTYSLVALVLAGTVARPVLRDNVEVMQSVVHRATHVPAVQIGVGCTTLTAALSYLLGAPRILQAGHAPPSWMHS